jgi:hypothetical protein
MRRHRIASVASSAVCLAAVLGLSLTAGFLATGEANAALGIPANLQCQGGKGLVVTVSKENKVAVIQFTPGGGPGQCAWLGRPFDFQVNQGPGGPADSTTVILPTEMAKAKDVLKAAKGGTFVLVVIPAGAGSPMQVAGVASVEVAKVDEPDDDVAMGDCPAGKAKVNTPPGLDFLNVRQGPDLKAKLVAQVPDGATVTVTGLCPKPGAGFAAPKLKPPLDADDDDDDAAAGAPNPDSPWCRISKPKKGCVSSDFLVFNKKPFPPGAGFAKSKNN